MFPLTNMVVGGQDSASKKTNTIGGVTELKGWLHPHEGKDWKGQVPLPKCYRSFQRTPFQRPWNVIILVVIYTVVSLSLSLCPSPFWGTVVSYHTRPRTVPRLAHRIAKPLSSVVALHGQLLFFLVHPNNGCDVEHHFHLQTLQRVATSPSYKIFLWWGQCGQCRVVKICLRWGDTHESMPRRILGACRPTRMW